MTSSDKILHIDLETYSEIDLTTCGVYAYVAHSSFSILLAAVAIDDEPTIVYDLTEPQDIHTFYEKVLPLIRDPKVVKVAHYAPFEFTCLAKVYGLDDYRQWQDTMVMAEWLGLPASLDQLGGVLGLEETKMSVGKDLIRYFCKPCAPTISNGGRTRNLPEHDRDKWEVFKEYNSRDTDVERNIYNVLKVMACKVRGPKEPDIIELDHRINATGIGIDTDLVERAIAIDDIITSKYLEEMKEITGLSNPNSTPALKKWLRTKGVEVVSLTKNTVEDLARTSDDPKVHRALKLKLLTTKTSTAKYKAIARMDTGDQRVRGVFQYYGASRSGRWAGRGVQLQNLPQNHIEELEEVRELVKRGDLDTLEMLYDSVPDVLSQLIRTAFVAKPGCRFIVADFSAIEARVIAWLAGESWRQEIFANNGDIYCASASKMFGVPVVKHGINGHLRQKGKVAELACGYQGGVGALKAMGGEKMGLTEAEMKKIIQDWRSSNRAIVRLWSDVQQATIEAIERGRSRLRQKAIIFEMMWGFLTIRLPSGRRLVYQKARLTETDTGLKITYTGVNQTSRKWDRMETYGGKLVENIVQAIARDCLAEAMLNVDMILPEGSAIVGHVHDEMIIEATEALTQEMVLQAMTQTPTWAKGLVLNADSYETPFYKKD